METKRIVKQLLAGFFLGLLTAFAGMFLFVTFFTEYDFNQGINILKMQGELGKIIALGAVLNLPSFFILLKKNKEIMARGVLFATIVITVITVIL